MSSTHEVSNQAPALENYNLFERNAPLIEAVEREGAADASRWLAERGAEIGSAHMIALGAAANRNPPTPRLFDRTGRRCDEVEFHPAYHELMSYLKRHGASAGPWARPGPGWHRWSWARPGPWFVGPPLRGRWTRRPCTGDS